MFTGIIEEIGFVTAVGHKENLSTVKIQAKKILNGIKQGDSVSVDGVCLTITRIRRNILDFDLMKETLLKTTLGNLQKRSRVNLERALKVGDRLSGHFITGHIDDVGSVRDVIKSKNYVELRIGIEKGLSKYFVPKGSVCVDGVSLTVGGVKKDYFSVYLIPFTNEVTTLGDKHVGDQVNIETDILAKYILNNQRASHRQ